MLSTRAKVRTCKAHQFLRYFASHLSSLHTPSHQTLHYTSAYQTLLLSHPDASRSSTSHSQKPLYTTSQTNSLVVIDAYTRSLRIVFISAIAMFFIVNILVFAIELPHLKKKAADVEEREEDEGTRVGRGT
jgi:hypothetical protein